MSLRWPHATTGYASRRKGVLHGQHHSGRATFPEGRLSGQP